MAIIMSPEAKARERALIDRWPTGQCGPVAVAGIFGVPLAEAIEMLLEVPGLPAFDRLGRARGVFTQHLDHWLVGTLGAEPLVVTHPDATERWRKARDAYGARCTSGGWWRQTRGPSYTASVRYTVTQFLKLHPVGTIFLGVPEHVLLARDGKVVADTLRTKSARRRVLRAYLIPGA
jgi:hypothetical protein